MPNAVATYWEIDLEDPLKPFKDDCILHVAFAYFFSGEFCRLYNIAQGSSIGSKQTITHHLDRLSKTLFQYNRA